MFEANKKEGRTDYKKKEIFVVGFGPAESFAQTDRKDPVANGSMQSSTVGGQ